MCCRVTTFCCGVDSCDFRRSDFSNCCRQIPWCRAILSLENGRWQIAQSVRPLGEVIVREAMLRLFLGPAVLFLQFILCLSSSDRFNGVSQKGHGSSMCCCFTRHDLR
ncbi:hypothetical protein Pmar_PMAR025432 [Perkinsus marinus ATCC 50983]|uniref:Uncharacterized protein n=1 Tax=Perkinsus marinus (strain ATCC 50983 / TXsc) TaxID=423536 RepID=C5KDH0_PERM5|nr:hypothetical protein Pmar_PMAR025432 [Perkinsus marinus ATCC 50983]EER17481.1 hypothetical protein Pmar_PMAR025432 [Perkinsus marinus ATCC 50983]|eukprot:XP_002785685.1 hypothetical protein Pmar_PMAR025432 [Perkinsus marinus ATCC 50983]